MATKTKTLKLLPLPPRAHRRPARANRLISTTSASATPSELIAHSAVARRRVNDLIATLQQVVTNIDAAEAVTNDFAPMLFEEAFETARVGLETSKEATNGLLTAMRQLGILPPTAAELVRGMLCFSTGDVAELDPDFDANVAAAGLDFEAVNLAPFVHADWERDRYGSSARDPLESVFRLLCEVAGFDSFDFSAISSRDVFLSIRQRFHKLSTASAQPDKVIMWLHSSYLKRAAPTLRLLAVLRAEAKARAEAEAKATAAN